MPLVLVAFILDEWRFALRLPAVWRVVRAATIEPLPGAPEIVLGLVNVEGRVIPVFDMRKRFGLPAREVELTDHFILARTRQRTVAMIVDGVIGVVEPAETETTMSGAILPGLDYIEGVTKLKGGLIFIHDVDTFLSLDEAQALDHALAATP